VWSADDALSLGLVDEIGTLADTLAFASEETGIPASCTKRGKSRTRAGNLIAEVLTTYLPGPALPIPDDFRTVQHMLSAPESVWAYCADCSGD
jgi:ClpP class serine protease